jgi:hypothetical protein
VERGNKYAGPCHLCGQTVPAGAGRLLRNVDGRRFVVIHAPSVWHGSPVSGRWAGGCPDPDGTVLVAAD